MRSQHIWTSRDEDGRKREVRVTKFGGNWKFQAKFRDEEAVDLLRRPADSKICASCATSFSGNINGGAPRRRISRRVDKMLRDQTPRWSSWDTEQLVADDKRYRLASVYRRWANGARPDHEPIVLVGGEGAIVRDSRGREYIDGNSSIWTNIHGHNHPRINAAIRAQLDRVAHTSFLGTTNPPAIRLAREIVELFPRGEIWSGLLFR